MKFFLPNSYVEYAINGDIKPGIYYYFAFIVNSVKTHDDNRILVHGIKIFNGEKSKCTLMHSIKLRPMFLGSKYKQKLLHFIGQLYEEIVFFPKFGNLTKNYIQPMYGQIKYNPDYLQKIPEILKPYFNIIHNPKSIDDVNNALNKLFAYEFSAVVHSIKPETKSTSYYEDPVYNLPFSLSEEQESIRSEIFNHLNTNKKLCALIHGDVGCGKTVIGYLVALKVVKNGSKVLCLAPTILLAQQIYNVFQSFDPFCKISLYTSKTKDLTGDIIVGTQALLFINLDNIGLVIIDEQHKFGTLQRQKITKNADLLMLSATPIPRTHYLAQMGFIKSYHLTNRSNNLIPYIIHEQNREPLIMKLLNKHDKRMVWVCKTIKLAEEMFNYVNQKNLIKCWIIHGQLQKKQEILKEFSESYGLLISTTVLEVGVDLDIHIMVVDKADQFGLAQLHQLKGRAGRHTKVSQCIFIGTNLEKLSLIKENHTGDKISQLDLELRGSGSIHQTNQSGKMFFFNKIIYNYKLIETNQTPVIIDKIPQEVIDFFISSKNYI